MTVRATQPFRLRAPFGGLRLLAAIALALTCFPTFSLHAAESITAHIDATGRMIFVNEDVVPNVPVRKTAPSSKAAATGRKVIATSAETGAETGSASPINTSAPESVPDDAAASDVASQAEILDVLIEQAAARHQIDPDLVRAIVRVESNYNPYAVSPAGARGLMQLIPATAVRFGVGNPFDPRANLDGGIRYLKYLLGIYQGDLQLSLAAYNAGEVAVARSGGIPTFRETQNYIRKIAELYPLRPMPGGLPPEPIIVKFVDSDGVVHFTNTDLP